MDMQSRIFLWKYNLLKPGSLKYYHELMANERKSPDELAELQWRKTFALIEHAVAHSRFYRKRLADIGAEVGDFRDPASFDAFPVLTRDDLQQHFDDILCDDTKRSQLNLSSTGGSSGKPVAVLIPRAFPRAALGWRMYSWWGLEPAVNWGRTYRETALSWRSRLRQFVIDFPARTVLLNASSFTEDDMAVFVRRFNRLRPPLLQGYVGAIDTLAEYVLSHHIEIHRPRAVWVTSAPLTAVQRGRIERAFQAEVFDQYGCCEVFWLAAECRAHRGLHVFQDARRIDFLDAGHRQVPTGQYGEIAITDLENHAFPIIRYLNGDHGRALAERCSCGCNLQLMDHVAGRISETIKLPSGRILNGEFITTLFDEDYQAVKRFHVHQNKDYSIDIQVVPNCPAEEMDKLLQKVVAKLRDNTGNEIPVRAAQVAEINLIRGKLRFITSDIK